MNDPVKEMNDRLAASPEAGPEDILTDATALLREAAVLYDARDQPDSSGLLRRLADALDPDGVGPTEEDADRMMAAPDGQLPTLEDLTGYLVRAVFALKSPTPDGSKHYRSGWDDGLEAAMDAIREAVPMMSPALERKP